MDLAILRWITNVFGDNKFIATLAKILSYAGSKWVIIATVALLLCFKKTRKVGIYAFIICGATWVANDFILKNLVKRARPFDVDSSLKNMSELAGIDLPITYSMASGHSAVTMALVVTIILFLKKWTYSLLAYPALVGCSRVVLCVHYLTDVVSGWFIGFVFAATIFIILNLIEKKLKKFKENKNEKVGVSNAKSK